MTPNYSTKRRAWLRTSYDTRLVEGRGAPIRVCLINDSSRNPNWGCRATSTALRGALEQSGHQVVATVYLEELLGLTVDDRRSWRHARERWERFVPKRPVVREVLGRTFDKVRKRLPDVVPREVAGLEAAADAVMRGEILESIVQRMHSADLIVMNGEGAIYGSQRMGRALMLLAYVAKTRLGKWVGMVNHTADLADPRMRAFAERVYPLLDLVTFRETLSAAACSSFTTPTVVPDMVFAYSPAPRDSWLKLALRPGQFDVWPDFAHFDASKPYAVIGGSAEFALVRSAGPPAQGANDPTPAFQRLISALQAQGLQVVLSASDRPDEAVFRPLAQALDLPLIGLATPVTQAVDLLSNASVYVGGRWHPAIFGLLGGTPFVPLSTNSHKLTGLAAMVDLPAPSAESLALEPSIEEVVSLATAHVAAGAPLRRRLVATSDRFRAECSQLGTMIQSATAREPVPSGQT